MATIAQARRGEVPSDSERLYVPRGAIRRAWANRDPELVLDGPAGTGKSAGVLNRIFALANLYPRSRWVLVRKTRESLTQSTKVTWEQHVLPEGWETIFPFHHEDQEYRFPNGSIVAVGGMDKASKIMSTEWDGGLFDEVTEGTEEDWESLSSRMRNGRVPWQQLVGCCNPDSPSHWILQRAARGTLTMIATRHEDNPRYWDAERQEWTAEGKAYIQRLDLLTGVRHKRLRLGQWVAAEGVIWDGWDSAIHLVDRFEVPKAWPRYLSIDFGYTNPFVAQFWTADPDGRLIRYREIYRSQTLVEDHAKQIVELYAKEGVRPRAIVCDHDAEGRATLHRVLAKAWGPRVGTAAAIKDVFRGIEAVALRLRKAGDGKPRLMLMRDSLVEPDPLLVEARLPLRTEDEIGSYVWDTSNGKKIKEEPLKLHDHGCDAMRYLVAAADLAGSGKPVQGTFGG